MEWKLKEATGASNLNYRTIMEGIHFDLQERRVGPRKLRIITKPLIGFLVVVTAPTMSTISEIWKLCCSLSPPLEGDGTIKRKTIVAMLKSLKDATASTSSTSITPLTNIPTDSHYDCGGLSPRSDTTSYLSETASVTSSRYSPLSSPRQEQLFRFTELNLGSSQAHNASTNEETGESQPSRTLSTYKMSTTPGLARLESSFHSTPSWRKESNRITRPCTRGYLLPHILAFVSPSRSPPEFSATTLLENRRCHFLGGTFFYLLVLRFCPGFLFCLLAIPILLFFYEVFALCDHTETEKED